MRERELVALENAVSAWGPASHAMRAVWGLVQAREDILANIAEPEFDYVGCARCRMAQFEMKANFEIADVGHMTEFTKVSSRQSVQIAPC
jgi:hypothetical protein